MLFEFILFIDRCDGAGVQAKQGAFMLNSPIQTGSGIADFFNKSQYAAEQGGLHIAFGFDQISNDVDQPDVRPVRMKTTIKSGQRLMTLRETCEMK